MIDLLHSVLGDVSYIAQRTGRCIIYCTAYWVIYHTLHSVLTSLLHNILTCLVQAALALSEYKMTCKYLGLKLGIGACSTLTGCLLRTLRDMYMYLHMAQKQNKNKTKTKTKTMPSQLTSYLKCSSAFTLNVRGSMKLI